MVKNTRTDNLNAQRQILEVVFKDLEAAGEKTAAMMVNAKLEAIYKELHISGR